MTHKSCYICDKCGKELNDSGGGVLPLRVTLHNIHKSGSWNTSFDFCGECEDKVMEIIKNGFKNV
jgi:hypothetical protein